MFYPKVLDKVAMPFPSNASFGPDVTGQYENLDIEYRGPGWYGIDRFIGTDYYCWRFYDANQNLTQAEKDQMTHSYGTSGSLVWIDKI